MCCLEKVPLGGGGERGRGTLKNIISKRFKQLKNKSEIEFGEGIFR